MEQSKTIQSGKRSVRREAIADKPCPIDINTKKVAMSPSILKMAKKDITRLRIETTFTIGLSLPKVSKPAIPSVKIKPTLHDQRDLCVSG